MILNKLIKKNDLTKKIKELAILINSRYKEEDVVILGVMNGSFFLMHDLIKKIDIKYSYDFLFCSSYYGRKTSSGEVDFIYPCKVAIRNKNVIVLEDIIDTGNTINIIYSKLLKYNPKNINIATLLARNTYESDLNLFWTGYKIKNEFFLISAHSKDLHSFGKIYETIHSEKSQKTYTQNLENNLENNSTWFYLNKQAAYVEQIAICEKAEESPLGPIKVILTSSNIDGIIDWIVFDD